MHPTQSVPAHHRRAASVGRHALPGPGRIVAMRGASSSAGGTIKAYQQRRFANTYADLLESPRYARVVSFFLDELYGRGDLGDRDTRFLRLLPAVAPLLPSGVAETLAMLAQLHRLSDSLDADMSRHVGSVPPTRDSYLAAWRATGRAADRQRQIELTLAASRALGRYARNPLLPQSLRALRTPAALAGFAELHGLLERGFAAFRAMGDSEEFVAVVAARECALATALFDASGHADPKRCQELRQLP